MGALILNKKTGELRHNGVLVGFITLDKLKIDSLIKANILWWKYDPIGQFHSVAIEAGFISAHFFIED